MSYEHFVQPYIYYCCIVRSETDIARWSPIETRGTAYTIYIHSNYVKERKKSNFSSVIFDILNLINYRQKY